MADRFTVHLSEMGYSPAVIGLSYVPQTIRF